MKHDEVAGLKPHEAVRQFFDSDLGWMKDWPPHLVVWHIANFLRSQFPGACTETGTRVRDESDFGFYLEQFAYEAKAMGGEAAHRRYQAPRPPICHRCGHEHDGPCTVAMGGAGECGCQEKARAGFP
jgi:hypothetical protein